MKLELNAASLKRYVLPAVVVIALGLVFWAEWQSAVSFFFQKIEWGTHAAIILGWVLLLEWAVKLALSIPVFDRHGSGMEMNSIRNRIGNQDERPGDATAVGVSYAAVWVFRAVLVLSSFLYHG